MKATRSLSILAAAALAAACATAGGGSGSASTRVKQADHAPLGSPSYPVSSLSDEFEISYIKDANNSLARGEEAQRSGNMDQARAEFGTAAANYAKFCDKFPSSDWALRVRYEAARLFLDARQYDKAAAQALLVHNHKDAQPVSKALGAKLMATAWLSSANAAMRAGKLEPVKFTLAEQRGGKPPEPRVPPGDWKKFIDAVDLYLANADADPEAKKPASERQGSPPAFYAQFAGEVSFGFDNMQDAQGRFDQLLKRWPQEAEFVAKAVPLYLQTFLILGDTAGHGAAVERLRVEMQAEAEKAPEDKKPIYAKVQTDLANAQSAKLFAAAQQLLEAGKNVEAAEAFEKLGLDPTSPDTPNALHNAAIAWDKAGQKDKGLALRQRIVKEYPDSKLAPVNQFQLAQRATEAKKYDDAVKLYQEFLERWPADRNRCAALQNIASALDNARKTREAAQASYSFATDPECAKGNPDTLAMALFRSGELFDRAKMRADARKSYAASAAVNGVTGVVAKSQADEARRRAKR
jgi:tetratricopeptide (TPR) repeat protein